MKPLRLTIPGPSESELQRQIVRYIDLRHLLRHHSPNEGEREPRTWAHLEAMGTSKGFPDLVIFEEWCDETMDPCRGFGIAIELKVEDRQPTIEQERWLRDLDDRGFLVTVAWTYEQAVSVIDKAVRR